VEKPPYLFSQCLTSHPPQKPVKARNSLTYFPTVTYTWRISYPKTGKLEVEWGLKETKSLAVPSLWTKPL